MTVSHISAFTPAAASVPPNVDMDTILAELSVDHVSAPSDRHPDELATIAGDARAHGIPLSIVVIHGNPGRESDLRDLATEVGKTEHGTIVVFSDDWIGTYSDHISRARLEYAEDKAKYTGGHTTQAAHVFVDRLEHGHQMPWTAVSAVLLVGTVAVVGGLYFVKSRRAAHTGA